MTSLTITAYHMRRAINWGILVIILYLIVRLSWGIFSTVWYALFPPPINPPNHAFGKLPAIQFPKDENPQKLTYRLETIEGYVPHASESAMVFFMPKNSATLTAITAAEEFAKQLEFTDKPKAETKNLYLFTDPTNPLRQLRYDIISKTFLLRYLYEQDATLFTERDVPLPENALFEARGFLQNFRLFPKDIDQGSTIFTFLKFVGNALLPTTSHSQADAMRVDFFRGGIAGSNIVTPAPDKGQVSFTYSGSQNSKKRMLEIDYNYWPVDYETIGTYALKPSTQAWEELQSGVGHIARYPTTNRRDVVIRKVYTAYYDSLSSQTYLQPVFVFEGDDGFMAFVPAVDPLWSN